MEDNLLKKLFDSFASRTLLALFGVLGTTITIYAFLQEKKVDLRYEVIANTNVLDFNADISKLEVTYDSTNLKQTRENLRIYTVKIINNGDQNIIKEFYDDNEPLGIKISSGKIIEQPQIIQTSSDYLTRNIKLIDYQKDRISFSQVIIESGEFFIVKLLVLHKKGAIPKIFSFGKIAGQKEIKVVDAIDVKGETTFWSKTFYGNIWVQLLRLILYFVVGVLIIILFVVSSERIDSFSDDKKRKKLVSEFKNLKTYQYTRMDDAIFDRYQKNDHHTFQQMRSLIKDDENLNKIYKELTEKLKSKEYKRFRRYDDNSIVHHIEPDDFMVINEMINDGIVFKEQDKLVVNQAMKDTLDKFVSFLKDKGELRKHRFLGSSQRVKVESVTTTDTNDDEK
ncbi:hypothetical protein [Parabacteroides sp. FAFU027]|uniref:hypothetical protein n=1 Tax=Parabacteroides sp. FAFU027 TaxID=2922715 RepID=UPI001FAF8233|nr:hypothetical protein [Parabacteroides sp. FAFU027]